MVKFIKRVGDSNSLFTRGKVYEAYYRGGDLYTLNDSGNESYPQWKMTNYWEVVKKPPPELLVRTCQEPLINNEPEAALGGRMIKVKHVNYITVNDKRIDSLDQQELLDVVIRERARIETIDGLDIKSPALDRIKCRHQANIDIILKELERREVISSPVDHSPDV